MWPRFVMLAVSVLAVSCGAPDRTVRNYKEIRFAKQDSPATKAASAPAPVAPSGESAPFASSSPMGNLPPEALGDKLPLAWDVPEGWESLGASGIRIATLRVEGLECTILSFPGDVGGDEANLRRWLGQIGQPVDDAKLADFVTRPSTFVSEGGFDVRLYDCAEIIAADAPQNVLAAMIPVAGQTVFIKFSGDRTVLAAQKAAFEQLCRSIRLREEAAY